MFAYFLVATSILCLGSCLSCSDKVPLTLQHDKNGNIFYVCRNGQASVVACDTGFQYNRDTKSCINVEDIFNVTFCPLDQEDTLYLPHEEACNKFYTCLLGTLEEKTCPSGLDFNPDVNVCDWPKPGGCGITAPGNNTTTQGPSNSTTESPNNSTTTQGPSNSTTDSPNNSTTPQGPSNSTTESPNNSTTPQGPSNSTESPNNSTTPQGPSNSTTPQGPSNSTESPNNSTTPQGPSNSTTESPNNSTTPQGPSNSTESPNNSTTPQGPSNSTTESPNNSTTPQGPSNSTTDSPNNSTTPQGPSNSTTESPNNSTTPQGPSNSTESPNNSTTPQGPSNSTTPQGPSNSTESPNNSTTPQGPSNSTESPNNSTTPQGPSNSTTEGPTTSKPNICIKNETTISIIPHETNCQKFFVCFAGIPTEYACDADKEFDPILANCVNITEDGCMASQITTITPGPTENWTDQPHGACKPNDNTVSIIAHESDCHKFYVCFMGIATEYICSVEQNLEFDPIQKICVPITGKGCTILKPTATAYFFGIFSNFHF